MIKKKMEHKNQCCEVCQYYWTCEKKWYRGERGQENTCCNLCASYEKCWQGSPAAYAKRT